MFEKLLRYKLALNIGWSLISKQLVAAEGYDFVKKKLSGAFITNSSDSFTYLEFRIYDFFNKYLI